MRRGDAAAACVRRCAHPAQAERIGAEPALRR